jgi:predicted RNA-binding Zn-ribbon protein involved in translation (DUF1610 family)
MSREVVTISQYRDLPAAGLAKSRLESAGITCFLDNEFTIGANWLYSNALGGVKLKVFEEDAKKAMEIINDAENSVVMPDETDEGYLSESVCPKCGASELEVSNLTRTFGAMSLLAGLPLFILLRKKFRCQKCGYRWK